MKTELYDAWREYCDSVEDRVDQSSFIAGWEACEVYAGRRIDELAFIGRQMAQGATRHDVDSGLRSSRPDAA